MSPGTPHERSFRSNYPHQTHLVEHNHVRRHSDVDSARLFLHSRYNYHYQEPVPLRHLPDRPLIHRVTNQWQTDRDKFHSSFDYHDYEDDDDDDDVDYDEEDEDDCLRDCHTSFFCTRRIRRYLCAYFLFLLGSFFYWTFYLKPSWREENVLDSSLARQRQKPDFFANARPQFAGMVQLQQLDAKFVPGASDVSKLRLVVVGDVHGCKEELLHLMEKITFDPLTDHLVFAGDMVFKGPDSAGVIDYAKSVGASCVRGNHEDRTILADSSLRHNVVNYESNGGINEPDSGDNEEPETRGFANHAQLARSLSPEQLGYLRSCPIILQVGKLGKQDYVVVHAGLVPGVKLDRQDPFHVMNMRTIDLASRVPTELRSGEPWDNVWNHYQKHTTATEDRITVIYGHDSKKGLNIKKYSKGLDSACVTGGKLSALVIDAHGMERLHSVICKNYKIKES